MTLDTVLLALDYYLNHKRIPDKLLKDENVLNTLERLLAEEKVNKDILRHMRTPTILQKYLSLPKDSLRDIFILSINEPFYLSGLGSEHVTRNLCKTSVEFARECRWVNRIIDYFDYFMLHHKPKDVFCTHYLNADRALNKRFHRQPQNLVRQLYRLNRVGIGYLLPIIAEVRPKVIQYADECTIKDKLLVGGIIRVFEYYQTMKKQGQPFILAVWSPRCREPSLDVYAWLKRKNPVEQMAVWNQVYKIRDEVRSYQKRAEIFKQDAVSALVKAYDIFLSLMVPSVHKNVKFVHFLKEYTEVKQMCDVFTARIYRNASRMLGDDGLYILMKEVKKQRPRITKYYNFSKIRGISYKG